MATTMKLIAKQTLGSNASTVTFSDIPGTYTDLLAVLSIRSTRSAQVVDNLLALLNGSSTAYTARILSGDGSAAGSSNWTSAYATLAVTAAGATSNTFSSVEIYIPNYAGSTNKSFSTTAVSENNATSARIEATATLWSNTAAVTSIVFDLDVGDFVTNSSFFLYGITKA